MQAMERCAYILYIYPKPHHDKAVNSIYQKPKKKYKHLTKRELKELEKFTQVERDREAEKSGFVVIDEYTVENHNLPNFYNMRTSAFHVTKEAAINNAFELGYTHYTYKDIKVKFRQSRDDYLPSYIKSKIDERVEERNESME